MVGEAPSSANQLPYFAYGSNMAESRLLNRQIDFLSREAAVLNGYRLAFNVAEVEIIVPTDKLKGYANIEPAAGERVEGMLYLLEPRAWDRLASFEDGYEPLSVDILTKGDSTIKAVTYRALPERTRAGLHPPAWYLAYLLEAANELSTSYVERLRKLPVIEEPENPERDGR